MKHIPIIISKPLNTFVRLQKNELSSALQFIILPVCKCPNNPVEKGVSLVCDVLLLEELFDELFRAIF